MSGARRARHHTGVRARQAAPVWGDEPVAPTRGLGAASSAPAAGCARTPLDQDCGQHHGDGEEAEPAYGSDDGR